MDPEAGQPTTFSTPVTPPLPATPVTTPVPALPTTFASMTAPTPRDGVIGGTPTGIPEAVNPSADQNNQDGIRIQIASGDAMAAAGYQVQWQPTVRPEDDLDPTKNPDMRLGGENGNIADVVAPISPSPDQVRKAVSSKRPFGNACGMI